jgi:hypothetical protein
MTTSICSFLVRTLDGSKPPILNLDGPHAHAHAHAHAHHNQMNTGIVTRATHRLTNSGDEKVSGMENAVDDLPFAL